MKVMRTFILFIHRLKLQFFIRWNRIYFKLMGVSYGHNLVIEDKLYVSGGGKIKIGDDFVFTSGAGINPICRNIRGAFNTVTKDSEIIIGDRVSISSACIWAKERITIGNDVNIGGDCIIIDNDAHPHNFEQRHKSYERKTPRSEYLSLIPSSPIVIEDDVWIGARCQILKGVNIGKRSIIAAGSVVTKDIPSDVMAGGNPCKVLKPLK